MSNRSFPFIDFKSLIKGQRLEVSFLESLFACKADENKYRNKLRSLLGEIKKYRPDLYPKSSKGAIIIMTDAEAAGYNYDRTDTLLTTTIRTIGDQSRIDPNKLEENEKRVFGTRVQASAAVAVQLAGSREKLRLTKLLKE